jgi:hypothetical protein
MRRLRIAASLLTSLLALVPAAGTTAAPAGTYYVVSAANVLPTICTGVECDTFTARYDYSGAGSCTGCSPTDPYRVGDFTITLVGDRSFPNDPIKVKSGLGTLTVVWADATTTATYSFKARDSKTYSLTGQVTGGTSTRFAAGTALDGLVGFPNDPILPSTSSAAVRFG